MNQYRKWLLEMTLTPTAAGCEARVISWVRRWARRRRYLDLRTDRFGQLILRRRGARSVRPVYFIAHMDHPAFVVTRVESPRRVIAEFRGGVQDKYFDGARVLLYHADNPPRRGIVGRPRLSGKQRPGTKTYEVNFDRTFEAEPGDVLTWDTGRQRVRGDRLYTLSTDNLAGVAAALSAFDAIHRARTVNRPDVRVLLTRCEEVGLVGATAACDAGLLPDRSRLIVLENSKSFADSPIGDGPIVRVGDRISTFDPQLTFQIGQIAEKLRCADPSFRWQRKLMPGGWCEATVFSSFGFSTACVCLALGNYHNMDERHGRIGPEYISLSDFDGLVRLLIALGRDLNGPKGAPSLKKRLAKILTHHRDLLAEPPGVARR